jgi:hypothetical protein
LVHDPKHICSYDPARSLARARWKAAGVSALVALLAMTLVYWRGGKTPQTPGPVAIAPAPSQVIETPKRDPQAAQRIYRTSIIPLLDEYDRENAQAVSRAMLALHERMQFHRAGVVPFARDVRSWGTRFGVMHRLTADLWHKVRHDQSHPPQVAQYINEKFRREVISEKQLQGDVASILSGFEQDLSANRNKLYSQLSLPLSQIQAELPGTSLNTEPLANQIQQRSNAISKELAPDTVVWGVVEFSGSWVATDVAQSVASRIVAQILARVGTSMAVEGLSAGGATVGGTTAGAGAGSLAGPVGTIIGLGAGLVVGATVDWWLSDQFEAKVTHQCNNFLNGLEQRLRDGGKQNPGLRQTLNEAARVAGQSQRKAIENAISESRKS